MFGKQQDYQVHLIPGHCLRAKLFVLCLHINLALIAQLHTSSTTSPVDTGCAVFATRTLVAMNALTKRSKPPVMASLRTRHEVVNHSAGELVNANGSSTKALECKWSVKKGCIWNKMFGILPTPADHQKWSLLSDEYQARSMLKALGPHSLEKGHIGSAKYYTRSATSTTFVPRDMCRPEEKAHFACRLRLLKPHEYLTGWIMQVVQV